MVESKTDSSFPETVLHNSKEWKFGAPLSQKSPKRGFLEKIEKNPTRVVSQPPLTTKNVPISKLKNDNNNNNNTNNLTLVSNNNNNNVASSNQNQKQTQSPQPSVNTSVDKKDKDPFNIFEPRL
jgi:hypothetical protein